jgi:DNA invertase Pin-like site-specific DNA recombinase
MISQGNGQLRQEDKILPKRKAAAYLRSAVSYASDDIRYPATREQAAAIHGYAEKHRLDIVKTYIDDGKSGLGLEGRDGLKNMMDDIQSGTAEYKAILMRDITRWGRGAPDECAHYEFTYRRAGLDVIYVDHPSITGNGGNA